MTAKALLNAYRDYISLRPETVVQEWLSEMDWNMVERDLPAKPVSAIRHLDGIEAHGNASTNRVTRVLQELADKLHWLQSYTAEDFGQAFVDNYGHVELFGTRGHFANDRFAGGVVIFGPGQHYPNHWHVAEEIYFPLTGGSLWGCDRESRTGGVSEKPAQLQSGRRHRSDQHPSGTATGRGGCSTSNSRTAG